MIPPYFLGLYVTIRSLSSASILTESKICSLILVDVAIPAVHRKKLSSTAKKKLTIKLGRRRCEGKSTYAQKDKTRGISEQTEDERPSIFQG